MFWSKKKFFTKEQEQRIVAKIQEAEKRTSGEIRVHVHRTIWKHLMADAVSVFHRLGMDGTKERNGVLFFLVPKTHQFAILADEGINAKVAEDFWECIKNDMEVSFKKGDFVAGLCEGIEAAGHQLKTHFPYDKDDINELPDTISYE